MNTDQPAVRGDWKAIPLSGPTATLRLDLRVTREELRLISLGHIPEDMDDKWFIFREDDTLFFHRSWTGHCVYAATIELAEEDATITSVIVTRDPTKYRSADDEYDVLILRFLIERILLGREVPFPVRPEAASSPPGLVQHVAAGTGGPEVTVVPRPASEAKTPGPKETP